MELNKDDNAIMRSYWHAEYIKASDKAQSLESELAQAGHVSASQQVNIDALEDEVSELLDRIYKLEDALAKEKQNRMNSVLSLVKVLETVITGD